MPTKRKTPITDIREYTILVYGREKIGKTVFFASFPDTLFLTTEPGSKGLKIFEYNAEDGGCKTWEHLKQAVSLLEKNPGQFMTVVIDTVDRAYDLCLDFICRELNIPHPGQDSSGREDFGKSWRAVKQEFLDLIHRILNSGHGVCFTSHAVEREVKTRSGDRFTRIFPSMSNQARSVVEALVDLFFYAEYMRAPDGSTQRVLVTEGDEMIWAGARTIGPKLPRFIPLTEKGGYDILQEAFEGKDVGLDPQTLMPARTASEAVKRFFVGVRAQKPQTKTKSAKRRRK